MTNFVKGKVADAIAADVRGEIANAKTTLASFTTYIKLCDDGHMSAKDDARGLLLQRNRVLKEARVKNRDMRPVAALEDSRVSEMRRILRMSEWKCWPTVL